MSERGTINEAVELLGVSSDTIRRRLKAGELAGEKVKTPQGLAWRVELPDDAPPAPPDIIAAVDAATEAVELAQLRERVVGLEPLAEELQSERDAWREQAQHDGEAARELRVLLRNEQMLALPADTTRQDGSGATEAPSHDVQPDRAGVNASKSLGAASREAIRREGEGLSGPILLHVLSRIWPRFAVPPACLTNEGWCDAANIRLIARAAHRTRQSRRCVGSATRPR